MSSITRRQFSGAAASAVTIALPRLARAQNYPTRPVRLILPFSAGGVADATARLAADKLGDKLGQRFVIENQPGPGGILAGRAIASAAPDGYTLGLLTNGTAISEAIYRSLPYHPARDFKPISSLGYFDLVFATNANSQLRTIADVLAGAREAPGKLNIGTILVGSTQQLGAALLKSLAHVNIELVTYRNTPEIIVAILRNDLALMVDFYAAMKGQLQDGKLRAIATSGLERSPFLPDVPTVAEAEVPGYEVKSWNALCAPAKAPAPIISLLNRAVREILESPELKAKYADLGIEAKASSPEEIEARYEADVKKWRDLIERAAIPKL
ncbi:MAG TPA: tripartite tricarboxylate transporter substrate-binding protein [Xanthobacteraceae bacterium]|jgi:tripartite-type tricarboxylate transporter receptor subunit TctC